MRANNQSVRILMCILLLMTGVCNNGIANPFPWVNNNKLWWNTDPNTPLSIEQGSLENRTNIVAPGSAICTKVFLSEDNSTTGIELRLQKNANEWLSAHWGVGIIPFDPASNYLGEVPSGTNRVQTLEVELAGNLSLPVHSGDTISVAAWARHDADGTTEVWWDDCFVINDAPPVITANVASPLLVAQGAYFVDPATCTDDIDADCSVIVSGDSVDTYAPTDTLYTLTYNATDSAGNTATPITQIVKIVDAENLDPFIWDDVAELWWQTDPSTPPTLNQHVLENHIHSVNAGDAVCTQVNFPYDSAPVTGVEVRLRVNNGSSSQWVSAHWGADPIFPPAFTSGSRYQGVGPPSDDNWHDLFVDLNGGFSDSAGNPVSILPGDSISGTAWIAHRSAEIVEIWWDNCTASENKIGPRISFPGGNPYRVMSTDNITLTDLYTCNDNNDGVCTASIDTNGLNTTGGNAEGGYEVTYTATDSDGNTTVARLKVTVDDTPPVLTLLDDNPFYVKRGTLFQDPSPPVTCENNGLDCVDWVMSNADFAVDTSVVGYNSVTYTYPWTQNDPVSIIRDVIVRHEQRHEAEHSTSYHNGGLQNASIETIDSINVSNEQSVLFSFSSFGSLWWQVDLPADAPAMSTYEVIIGYSVNYPVDGNVDVIVNEGTATEQVQPGVVLPSNGVLHKNINTARVEVPIAFNLQPGSNTVKLLDNTQIPGVRIDYIEVVFDNLLANQDGSYTSSNEWTTTNPPEVILFGGGHIVLNSADPFLEPGFICFDDVDGVCTNEVATQLWQDYPTTQGSVDLTQVGRYELVYSITDSDGNTAVVVREIQVIDAAPGIQYGGFTYESFGITGAAKQVSQTINEARLYPFFGGGTEADEMTPAATAILTRFESSSNGMNVGGTHGERLHGFVTPRFTGLHEFYVSGNKDVELYLNYDENQNGSSIAARAPFEELTKVAEMVQGDDTNSFYDWYTANDYDWSRWGQAPLKQVHLEAGKLYYVAAVTKSVCCRTPTDKVQIAWKEPTDGVQTAAPVSGSAYNLIPGGVLAPWTATDLMHPQALPPDAPPVIDLVSENPLEHQVGVPYTDVATCIDVVDTNCTVTVIDWGTPAMNPNNPALGQYTITLSATDSAGNTATATRTIDVVETPLPVLLGGLTYESFATGGAAKQVGQTIGRAKIYPLYNGGTEADEMTPSATTILTAFESSSNGKGVGGNHGERLHGYIVPNISGIHQFYVSGNKDVELYLNYDANNNQSPTTARAPAAELTKVAEMVQGDDANSFYDWYTASNYDWYRWGQAPLEQVHLEAGKAYYIMALSKSVCCRNPTDKIQIAWQEPAGGVQSAAPVTGSANNIIPASVLAPWSFVDAAPTIDLVTSDPLGIVAGSPYSDAATCADDVDATCTVTVVDWGTPALDPNNPAVGLYSITLSTTDSAGNTATRNRMIEVFANAVPPAVELGFDAAVDAGGDRSWEPRVGNSFYWDLGGNFSPSTVNSAHAAITSAYRFNTEAGDSIGGLFSNGNVLSLEHLPGNPTNNSASFELWFKAADIADHDVLFETGATGDGISIRQNGSGVELNVKDGGSNVRLTYDLVAAGIDPTAEFIQLVGVVSVGGNIELYINGNLVDQNTSGVILDWAGSDGGALARSSGNMNDGNGVTSFEGQIAIFNFYEIAVTAAEVAAMYDFIN